MSTYEHSKIIEFFFDYPSQKIHLRELARKTGLSPTGASKILRQLVKDGLIIKEKTKLAVFYRPNYDNKKFYIHKKANNLLKLRTSEFLSDLIRFYRQPETIVVFGSYADGTDTEKSDIDILVITKITKKFDASKYEKYFKRSINIITIPSLKKASKEFINNIVNGSVLYGYLQVNK